MPGLQGGDGFLRSSSVRTAETLIRTNRWADLAALIAGVALLGLGGFHLPHSFGDPSLSPHAVYDADDAHDQRHDGQSTAARSACDSHGSCGSAGIIADPSTTAGTWPHTVASGIHHDYVVLILQRGKRYVYHACSMPRARLHSARWPSPPGSRTTRWSSAPTSVSSSSPPPGLPVQNRAPRCSGLPSPGASTTLPARPW